MTPCPSCGHENPEDSRFCPQCGAVLGGGLGEHRKVVSVLFCDVVGSTALGESSDPEALRGLLARYFERMKGIVESHGGTVEKFIGDAVMAVFGVPVVHEDDALRACRAAVEMRDALPTLGIQGRVGVNTGEVVTGTAERLVTGDAVNVAARFEQAAAAGEVLIGKTTHELVQGAVDAEPVEPLVLKGKAEPVAAFRLLAAHAAPERRHDSLFVGRERELGLLSEAWERAVAEQRCELVTVVGEPGIGKSRLAAEAFASIDARIVRGRCLPYGAGITYWPVVEVVKQLDVLPTDPAAAAALRSLLGERDAGNVGGGDRLGVPQAARGTGATRGRVRRHSVGRGDLPRPDRACRAPLERCAAAAALHGAAGAARQPPDVAGHDPTRTARRQRRGQSDRSRRAGRSCGRGSRPPPPATRSSSARCSRWPSEAGDEVEVPASLKALLAARLDQLDPAERRVLECGSVEGEVFHRGAVQALTPEETQVTPRLAALVRRELIRSDRPQFAGEDGFRFRHLLIRDTAYDALPKATRAALHERFAAWLEQRGQDLVERDEIVGYHLEQASLYKSELGQSDPGLAGRAAEHLAAAGHNATWRGDDRAAARLLERALELTRRERLDVVLELDLARAFADSDPARAATLATAAAERANAAGDRTGELLARRRCQLLPLVYRGQSEDRRTGTARQGGAAAP